MWDPGTKREEWYYELQTTHLALIAEELAPVALRAYCAFQNDTEWELRSRHFGSFLHRTHGKMVQRFKHHSDTVASTGRINIAV